MELLWVFIVQETILVHETHIFLKLGPILISLLLSKNIEFIIQGKYIQILYIH